MVGAVVFRLEEQAYQELIGVCMSNQQKPVVRCAIYTRKSTEEGLEQAFNSLDAQREACAAFIASQRNEGWQLISTAYDDGGYSGGNMGRPALKQLLDHVAAGQVDTIVVYKVDRLSRSLSDFAKIVEALDARSVSFVSVTQQFNTTTSMGRLTLNILLSFAQFEREVTGERIRDKIAASKRKGMWMGGTIPLGYDVTQRKLVVNVVEANLVNDIYRCYLELGSVSKLKTSLDEQGIKSKRRISPTGNESGGVSFLRGALYLILQNRTYLGEVLHRSQSYPGEHQAIVPRDLWERVQAQLRSDNGGRRNDVRTNCSNLLLGLLQDVDGNRFRPSHTVKSGRRYRYYFLTKTDPNSDRQSNTLRLPAYDIERLVYDRLQSFLQSTNELMRGLTLPEDNPGITQQLITGAKKLAKELSTAAPAKVRDFVRKVVRRVVVQADNMEMQTSRSELRASIAEIPADGVLRASCHQESRMDDLICLTVEARLRRCGKEMRLVVSPDYSRPEVLTPILKAVARAHKWREGVLAGDSPNRNLSAKRLNVKAEYFRRILGCAFLAPDILEAILEGSHPSNLTVKKLHYLPLDWAEQRVQLGFSLPSSQGKRKIQRLGTGDAVNPGLASP
jgi:site-specific DNA recombinase